MKSHLHPHPSSRYDRIEGDDLAEPRGSGRKRRRRRGGSPGMHRGHRGHRGHGRRPDAATRRARLEAYQRDLEQELADVAERIRRIDEAS